MECGNRLRVGVRVLKTLGCRGLRVGPSKLRRIPAPIKVKSALPPPIQNNPPRPKMRNFMDIGFLQKERIFPGAHKIGAAISGPRISDTNFTGTRIFLIRAKRRKGRGKPINQRAANGGSDPSWLNLAFLGRPDVPPRGPQNPLEIGIWGPLDGKSGHPKNAKSYHDGSQPPRSKPPWGAQPRDSDAIVSKTSLKQARNKNAIEAAILNRVLDRDWTLNRRGPLSVCRPF